MKDYAIKLCSPGPPDVECVSAEGFDVEHGALIFLGPPDRGQKVVVKAYAPGCWFSVEPNITQNHFKRKK